MNGNTIRYAACGAMVIVLCSWSDASGQARPFDNGKVGFSVRYKSETSSYRVNAVFVLPGESLTIEIVESSAEDHAVQASAGSLARQSARAWS